MVPIRREVLVSWSWCLVQLRGDGQARGQVFVVVALALASLPAVTSAEDRAAQPRFCRLCEIA